MSRYESAEHLELFCHHSWQLRVAPDPRCPRLLSPVAIRWTIGFNRFETRGGRLRVCLSMGARSERWFLQVVPPRSCYHLILHGFPLVLLATICHPKLRKELLQESEGWGTGLSLRLERHRYDKELHQDSQWQNVENQPRRWKTSDWKNVESLK